MGVEIEMSETDLGTIYRIDDCTRCRNECASSCPVYRHYGKHHPQELAHLYLRDDAAARDHRLVAACVTCRACTEACPFDVEFADFIRGLRVGGTNLRPSFGGLVQSYQRRQAAGVKPAAAKARLSWIDKSLEIGSESGVVLFAGCLSLFDALGSGAPPGSFVSMAKAAVKLLNRLGVRPAVLEDERCCGRDLYDTGERAAFEALARHNLAQLEKAKATTVLAVCPECAFTLKDTYARALGGHAFEVLHVTEYLAERIGGFSFEAGDETLAFHDPCYLCRYLGVESAPRELLAALSTAKPVELERRGRSAPCCGAGSLVEHGPHTRTAVDERLVEVHHAGAGTLVTACPKCTLLYAEVLGGTAWRPAPVEVKDLLTLAAARLST